MGDRRRRRLAVESDDIRDHSGESHSLPESQGAEGVVDGADADCTFRNASSGLPVTAIIPVTWWSYPLGAMTCISFGGGLLIAGWCAPDWSKSLGPGIGRLFAFPGAPAARWFSSVLLALAAQLALLIWWARSQSRKDFDGRYWLWIRVSAMWLVFSGCVETGAHEALRETICHLWPGLSSERSFLSWLIPGSAIGSWTVAVLAREMRDCRWSRALLLLAAFWYLCATWFNLELAIPFSKAVCFQLREASLLGGHISLFLSMWVHARHVLHCTPDPAARPRSRWRIPRPHFRLSGLRLPSIGLPAIRQELALPTNLEPAIGRPASKRKSAAKSTSAELADAIATSDEQPAPTNKPNFRFDVPHAPLPEKIDKPPTGSNDGGDDRKNAPPAPGDAARHASKMDPVELADLANKHAELDSDGDLSDARDGESGSLSSKPDLRGLSKKQRRKLLQEFRERERAASGG